MFHDFAYRIQESVPNKSASNEFVRKRALSFFIWYSKSDPFDQIPFISENEAVEAAIQSVDAPYQDFVSTMLKKPDELRWMFEAYQKFQRKKKKEEAAPESLIGLLEKQSSVQTEIETERTPDEDELGEYGAVQNLKHREKKEA